MRALGTVYVFGRRTNRAVPELRRFLDLNRVGYTWVDVDDDALVGLLSADELRGFRLPMVLFPDGTRMEAPESHHEPFAVPSSGHTSTDPAYMEGIRWRAELAGKLGLATTPTRELYDVIVAGGGPAGLTAAVYAASEGLRTVVFERTAPGGQAGTSARIENYLGFTDGVRGADLAAAAHEQALRFGAEILVGVEILRGEPRDGEPASIELSNGAELEAWAGIVATGVHYRRLVAAGVEELIGAGVHYGSSPSEAAEYADRDVFVVGAANSAGQATLHLAVHAHSVTLLARRATLSDTMSSYLIERIESTPNIHVLLQTEVDAALGEERLEQLVLANQAAGERTTVSADGLFILIGGEPLTGGYEGWLRRDERGFLVTGPDLLDADENSRRWWPLERAPTHLESSQPGMFVAGDVRAGSVKRVASAVGEGAMAVQLVHRYLQQLEPTRTSKSN